MKQRPNFIVILIDDLRYDEFGAGGHPYMKTPHTDRIAHEGALFERAFHTTPICSPNRASMMTGQYASRHGIIDNVARDAMSHRLPNYHLELQKLGYETAHIGKWHMGNDGKPRPGYDRWVSFDGHGRLDDPTLNIDGAYEKKSGYITDLLNDLAVQFIEKPRAKPFALFFAHKAVHPDAVQAADGTLQVNGYRPAERHKDLYKGCVFPKYPNMLSPAQVVKQKPAWADAFELKKSDKSKALLESLHAGNEEEIRLRAAMMASVDEGVGRIFAALEQKKQLDNTVLIFLGDNGYFFGEHGLGPERRFAYEAGIRSPFVVRFPKMIKSGTRVKKLIICQDIAPHAESNWPAAGRGRRCREVADSAVQRKEAALAQVVPRRVLAEQALPWLVGMSYKAVRTDRYKLIHWVNRGKAGELDELYDLEKDPWEMKNLIANRSQSRLRDSLRRELRRLATEALGL